MVARFEERRYFDWRVGVMGLLLLVGALVTGVAMSQIAGAPGAYNVYSEVRIDGGMNGTGMPKCDNGNNFMLVHVVEWSQGARMVKGSECIVAAISAEEISKLIDAEMQKDGIDPLTAPADLMEGYRDIVLRDWAAKILAR